MNEKIEEILIIDFGSQYTQLILRRIKELKVKARIVNFKDAHLEICKENIKGIILSGGPQSVYSEDTALFIKKEILSHLKPTLGICYGMQLIAYLMNGKVRKAKKAEFGKTEFYLTYSGESSKLFEGARKKSTVWMSHNDEVFKEPDGFTITGKTENSNIASFENQELKLFAVQFHPEVFHTEHGFQIISNFLFKICNIKETFKPADFIENAVVDIKRKVGKSKVISALSGGLDSSVTTVLMYKAIGNNLIPIFINNGLLRKNEEDFVVDAFKKHFKMNLHYVDASSKFLKALKGIEDPEEKRKIIGRVFVEVFEEEALKIKDAEFLAQGTLYPDVIESSSHKDKASVTIKTHHNVGGLPEKMKLKVIEPLRELFKDEVRAIGRTLELPFEILTRHPFPGPGLAVRCIGEITEEKLNILKNADIIIQEELKNAELYESLWQAFGILLPVKSVGVMGDFRTYEYTLVLRAVLSEDGMTADFAKIPYEVLSKISKRITEEVKGINRVLYDITTKPPATIEWE